ncbi:MAG TPA: phage repressor protein CI [Shigella sp.]|nr:phage repressor protein CI [Shigella sp.]
MVDSREQAQAVLTRMKEAYKVRTNVEFSNLTGVPQPTISNWINRGSVPFRYIYECSHATGIDIEWLQHGQLENARFESEQTERFDKNTVYNELIEAGGKAVLQRILQAYGFTMQKQLGDLMGISSGTMSTWIRRDYFPGDVVVACALDTGVSLRWLATGRGSMLEASATKESKIEAESINKYELFNGSLLSRGHWTCDPSLLDESLTDPALIERGESKWLADLGLKLLASGTWLINIDGVIDVYEVSRLPGNKLNLKNSSVNFQCLVDDVECVGKICFTLSKNN